MTPEERKAVCPVCRGTGIETVRPYNAKLPCSGCQYEDEKEDE